MELAGGGGTGGSPVSVRLAAARAQVAEMSPDQALGQMLISGFAGTTPPRSFLTAVRRGHVGGVILFASNTAGGVTGTRALVDRLQRAARRGGRPGLLIVTDQEGGEVARLPGPPTRAADAMGDPAVAAAQGTATARLLRRAGVDVDLAPVADVARTDGFLEQQHRTFGTRPATVAAAACAFAQGLSGGDVGYTLKHFPGLGDAIDSTDDGPVTVTEPPAQLSADQGAYRRCGAGPRALVMLSSAAYTALGSATPAVLDPAVYARVLPGDGVNAVTISDELQAPAITAQRDPARRAVAAGLDLLLYGQTRSGASQAYAQLSGDLAHGTLSAAAVRAAATRVLGLKRSLGLPSGS